MTSLIRMSHTTNCILQQNIEAAIRGVGQQLLISQMLFSLPHPIYCVLLSICHKWRLYLKYIHIYIWIMLKSKRHHMKAKLADCPKYKESIQNPFGKSVHFSFSLFKQTWKIPRAHSRYCFRQRSGSINKGQESVQG